MTALLIIEAGISIKRSLSMKRRRRSAKAVCNCGWGSDTREDRCSMASCSKRERCGPFPRQG
jgi:hypothetical protein